METNGKDLSRRSFLKTSTAVSAGASTFMILKPELVRSMNESRCAGELYRGFWADVGTKERLAALNEGSAGAS